MSARRGWLYTAATLLAVLALAVFAVGPLAATSRAAEQGPLTAAQARKLSRNVTDRVIIVLRNQFSAIPDRPGHVAERVEAVRSDQQGVLSELSATHAKRVRSFQVINAISATVSPGEAHRLARNPDVSEVVPDGPVRLAANPTVSRTSRQTGGLLSQTCARAGSVQLNPEAVEAIHAAEPGTQPSAQRLGYTGTGIKVGFIADGLNTRDPDFIRRDGKPVFFDYQDFSGEGTDGPTNGGEAFLDASSIAAQGRETYNIQSYAGLPKPCDIRILGVAPGASLAGLNIFGDADFSYTSVYVAAINYAVTVDHVNVLNESLGDNPFPDNRDLDIVEMANDSAVKAGVTVTSSAGDSGPFTNTIDSPASDPAVISAGATTTYRAYAQTAIGGITYPGVKRWLDDNISGLSSGGFTRNGLTDGIVAPGDLNWALCTPDPAMYSACTNFFGKPASVELTGGTSEASPLTAGVAALVDQAYKEHHHGTLPTPAVVKRIISSTAENINAPADQQGPGMLDAYAAVKAAAAYGKRTGGPALIKSATELHATAAERTPESFSETVTNAGSVRQRVSLSSRRLSAYRLLNSGTTQLEDSSGDFSVVKFAVPKGQARLNSSIAYQAPGPSSDFDAAVNLSLISPSGRLAEYNLPQGAGNYGDAQVADPQPGVWTELIDGPSSSDGGTTGSVAYENETATWVPFGKLSRTSLSLAPGASKTVRLKVDTPSQPGDEAGSILFTTHDSKVPSFARTTTVPVTLRALIPTPSPKTTFTGQLIGGNGRSFDTGETEYYQVNIPRGLSELNASIASSSSANTFVAELVDPVTGEAASTAASGIPGSTSQAITPESGAQLHVLHPDAGRWTLIVNFYNQVSGRAVSQPFTVTMNSVRVPVSGAVPDSTSDTLPHGSPTTVDVKVTNNGSTPEAYFVDARLNHATTLNLSALDGDMTPAPTTGFTYPIYLVPTHTTSITASAKASAPIYFDYSWAFGDPNQISTSPPSTTASGTFGANPVVAGTWGIVPFQKGPDGAHGVPTVTATTAMSAKTDAFDPEVSASTGDLWLQALDPSTPLKPVVAAPGQTVTIPVTITPTGAPGSVVDGTIYVDDITRVNSLADVYESTNGDINQGSDLAAIPYEYTVGDAK